MKNTNRTGFYNPMKNITLSLLLLSGILSSCMDNTPVNVSTFTQEMMGQYLQDRGSEFSEFTRLMDTTEVLGLVNAYGKYTLFAPNNTAMKAFYASKGRTSLKEFQLDTLKKIAYDHLIKGYIIKSNSFTDGLMPYLTMSDRFVATSSQVVNKVFYYYINATSAVIAKDIEVSNGVIHEIDRVLTPSALTVSQSIGKDPKFTIFNEALEKTGLVNQITAIRDDSYDPKNYSSISVGDLQGSGSKDELPVSRKYGFTALMESDATYKNLYGINNLEDLKAYAAAHVYNENKSDASVTDITDPRNSLNKFIAYHLIDKKLTYSKFIDAYDTDHMLKTFDMYEYIETMCPNTLMEVKKERSTGLTNIINKISETGEAVHIVTTNKDNDATNGVYHEIDKILIYDSKVAAELSSKRLRMDAATFFPEFTNNNMRYYDKTNPRSWVFPKGYIKRLTCSETTRFTYLNAADDYLDYEGDELYLKGMYDFEMVTPPVPAGTYEVRFSYQPTDGRGAAQLYWDGVPCGIPLDLRIIATDPLIGYEAPETNLDDYVLDASNNKIYGVENDKMMRNRGYMKGPNTYQAVTKKYYDALVARKSSRSVRRILGTYTFTTTANHKFAVKAVRQGQFMMDFLEFVPVEMIENENIE